MLNFLCFCLLLDGGGTLDIKFDLKISGSSIQFIFVCYCISKKTSQYVLLVLFFQPIFIGTLAEQFFFIVTKFF